MLSCRRNKGVLLKRGNGMRNGTENGTERQNGKRNGKSERKRKRRELYIYILYAIWPIIF